LRYLCKAGANANLCWAKYDGMTNMSPLMYAVRLGRERFVSVLLRHCENIDVNLVCSWDLYDCENLTALHLAVLLEEAGMVDLLCSHPGINISKETKTKSANHAWRGKTPTDLAYMNGYSEILHILQRDIPPIRPTFTKKRRKTVSGESHAPTSQEFRTKSPNREKEALPMISSAPEKTRSKRSLTGGSKLPSPMSWISGGTSPRSPRGVSGPVKRQRSVEIEGSQPAKEPSKTHKRSLTGGGPSSPPVTAASGPIIRNSPEPEKSKSRLRSLTGGAMKSLTTSAETNPRAMIAKIRKPKV